MGNVELMMFKVVYSVIMFSFFFSSIRRHTRCALVTGVRRVLFRSQQCRAPVRRGAGGDDGQVVLERHAPSLSTAADGDPAPGVGELADQPIRLQRVVEPRLGPAAPHAGPDGPRMHPLAVAVEPRALASQLPAAAADRTGAEWGKRVEVRG